MLKDDLKSLVLNTLWSVNWHREQLQSSLWYRNTTPAIDFSEEMNLKFWLSCRFLNKGQCWGLWDSQTFSQSLSVCQAEGAALGSEGSRDWFALCSGVQELFWGCPQPQQCSMGGEWWQLWVFVLQPWGAQGSSLPAPVSHWGVLIQTSALEKGAEGFSGPLPLIGELCFTFCWFLPLLLWGWVHHISATVRGAVSSQWANFPNSCRLWARVIMAAKANCVWVRLKPY